PLTLASSAQGQKATSLSRSSPLMAAKLFYSVRSCCTLSRSSLSTHRPDFRRVNPWRLSHRHNQGDHLSANTRHPQQVRLNVEFLSNPIPGPLSRGGHPIQTLRLVREAERRPPAL